MNKTIFDAIDYAQSIKEKNSEEVISNALEKIKYINSKINAVNQLFDYHYIENQIQNLNKDAPFAGVPLLIKELGVAIPGIKSTFCSRLFQDYVPDFESEIVKRLKKMGFILIGKSNAPEMGLSFATEPMLNGPTRNPLNLNKTPGGSSGGAAAAVASGMVPIAHASDGGGSIRTPAACCGLIGLKPTRARIPQGPLVGEGWSGLSTNFMITQSIRDTAISLDWLSGAELGDPYCAPSTPKEGFAKAIQKPLSKLKIAYYLRSPTGSAVAPECKNAVTEAVNRLASQGHLIEKAWPKFDFESLLNSLKIIMSANSAWVIQGREMQLKRKALPNELEPNTWLFVEQGRKYSAIDYSHAIFQMHNQSRKIANFFEHYDVLITPALAQLPVDLGYFSKNYQTVEEVQRAFGAFSPFTALWNQTGQPAITFPCYHTTEGFPVSIQVIGRFGDEETLLKIAKVFCEK